MITDHSSILPVASGLAVDDALGLVIDHSGLSLNNNSVSGIRPNHKRLRKGCIGQSRLALDNNRLRAKYSDSKLDQDIAKIIEKSTNKMSSEALVDRSKDGKMSWTISGRGTEYLLDMRSG